MNYTIEPFQIQMFTNDNGKIERNIVIDGKKVLPFNVCHIFTDCCVGINYYTFNLFNIHTRKFASKVWFTYIDRPTFVLQKINNALYKSNTKLFKVHLNNKFNYINYDGEFLYKKWVGAKGDNNYFQIKNINFNLLTKL